MKTRVYAGYNKNAQERYNSSSGGIYPLIARSVLECGGVVFAACYDKQLDVEHVLIDNLADLILSQGSKYVSSRLKDTFCKILEQLNNQRAVLFVGTPCQCEGLLSFLKVASCNIDNLICMDFICHGIPSRKAWHHFQKSISKSESTIISVNMRDKTSGWSRYNYSWKISDSQGNNSLIHQNEVTYMKGFVNDIYLRPSCYKCKAKGVERNTDITLGDYWGVWDLHPYLDDNIGTSLIFLHSEKGLTIFNNIKTDLIFEEITFENALESNQSIIKPAIMNNKRSVFFERMKKGDEFESIIKDLLHESYYQRIKKKVKRIIWRGKSC